ncbi:L-histidine N(alpha)-methyltransferase [Rhodococcus sp. NPDC058521]|uniref:L-histidine N(alpha)-methyltransferase n=1 Tax=Rhodococcus sp. NPDC058521 TaxID=3346536 RepID=UPI00364F8A98
MNEPTVDVYLKPQQLTEALRDDVRIGLTSIPKWLPPKWFYDAHGSELFERITTLPEYYPTRTERELLQRFSGEIASLARPEVLVELGSGSSEKTRLLLDAALAEGTLHTYVPQDVSISALEDATQQIATEFPALTVHGVVSDFTESLHHLPGGGCRTIVFLGGTLGNMVPAERAEFLSGIANVLESGESLVLGVGLVTDTDTLVAAYDDRAGVTAEFDKNVLRVLNRELQADFVLDDFRHVAVWDPANEWIEMRLRATRDVEVDIRGLGMSVSFDAEEFVRTEISAKFTVDGIGSELVDAGFSVEKSWVDPDNRFALLCATAM